METLGSVRLVVRTEIDAAVQNWVRDGHQVLHIVGLPGAGKTSWVRTVVQQAKFCDAQGVPLAEVAAYYYCERNNASTASTIFFLEQLAIQFASFDSRYAQALIERTSRERGVEIRVNMNLSGTTIDSAVGVHIETLSIRGMSPADLFRDVVAPLEEILSSEGPDWLVLIDAPDEPIETGVADLLCSFGSLPRRLRVIVTSRPSVPFARGLQSVGADRLDLAVVSADSPSLAAFIKHDARERGVLARLVPGLAETTFLAQLAARVKDNFLVARCAIDALVLREGALDLSALTDLPDDLPGFYRASLDRLPHEFALDWPIECGLLLGILAVAREPLSMVDLSEITGLRASLVQHRLMWLQPYLQHEKTGWRLFHTTFAEFLLEESEANEYWCPEIEQHHRLIGWATASGDWMTAPAYGLKHFVEHTVAADGPHMLVQLERAVAPAFIAARVARGAQAYSLVSDFKRALDAVCVRGAVEQTVFLTVLLALWQDRAAEASSPTSTILLAATGHIAEASALALRQDAAGHADIGDASFLRAEYARRLVAMGENDAAISFARQSEAQGDSYPLYAVLEALAIDAPARALAMLSDPSFDKQLQKLSPAACRGLASISQGLQMVLTLVTDNVTRRGIAEGCALHDLDTALSLVPHNYNKIEWIGGDAYMPCKDDGIMRVLHTFVEAYPSRVAMVWERAGVALRGSWCIPHGVILAAAIAAGDPQLGLLAYEKLDLPRSGESRSLAVAWIGARGGAELFGKLAQMRGSDRERDEVRFELFPELGLPEALQILALINPEIVVRKSAAFDSMCRIGDRLLLALASRNSIPESKMRGAFSLGRFFGWLGQTYVERLLSLGAENWRDETWQYQFAEGVATSLAHAGADAYIAASDPYSPLFVDLRWNGTLQLVGEIIAERNAIDALRIIDSIPARSYTTRSNLVSTVAVVMRRSGRAPFDDLLLRLDPYTESPGFLRSATALRRGLDNVDDREDPSDVELALKQLQLAITSGVRELILEVIPAVENLNMGVGKMIRGETIWAADLRRLLAAELESFAPERALQVLLPLANLAEVRALAHKICAQSASLSPTVLADIVRSIAGVARVYMSWPMWVHQLALAFALELHSHLRLTFLETLFKTDGCEILSAVRKALDVFDDPKPTLRELELAGEEPTFDDIWLASLALSEVSVRDPGSVFDQLERLGQRYAFVREMFVGFIAKAWPIDRWTHGIESFLQWTKLTVTHAEGWTKVAEEFIITLLERIGKLDLAAALESLGELAVQLQADETELSNAQKKIILASVQLRPIDAARWPLLVAAAGRISYGRARATTITKLLSTLKDIDPKTRAHCTTLTIGALGAGPREPILQDIELVAYAAVAAEPTLAGRGGHMIEHLRSLLSISVDATLRNKVET